MKADQYPDKMTREGPALSHINRSGAGVNDTQALTAVLADRGLVAVAGPSAVEFLQGLVSNDVRALAPGECCYAALLTPQGKLFCDFLILAQAPDTFYLDCPKSESGALVKRLNFYRLRAKVHISDRSDQAIVAAGWSDDTSLSGSILYRDPRDSRLGWRSLSGLDGGAVSTIGQIAAADYEAHRIRLRIPRGGVDFSYLDTFPHDANIDLLHGIDFKKGCYVGQEVVARMHHRGGGRKRVARVFFVGPPPPCGAAIRLEEALIGVMGSSTSGQGLAMLRIDKARAAVENGAKIAANDQELAVELDF